MTEKYLLFNLDDEKSKKLGEVISNPTCKKIVNFLAEKEASETDIAKELGIPINTAEYNLKKLLDAEIIEKSKDYFWSRKGKKIDMYKVANKLIVISPKKSGIYSKLKNIVPVVVISGIFTAFILWYQKLFGIGIEQDLNVRDKLLTAVSETASTGVSSDAGLSLFSNSVLNWFLILVWIGIVIFVIYSWRKK